MTGTTLTALAPVVFEVPVEPSPGEARDLLIQELAGADYQAARPNLFDRIVQQIFDWIDGLGGGGTPQPGDWVLPTVVIVLVVGALVAAVLLFGRPRLGARSRAAGDVFDTGDERSAAALRQVAERAAADGDWATAVVERYRALARGLDERTVLAVTPGATAQGIARNAGAAFPASAAALVDAADRFDRVRYLGLDVGEPDYRIVEAVDLALARVRPVLEPAPFGGTGPR